MPILSSADAELFEAHGSRFHSFLRTERGAETLCAWRLEVAPDLVGVAHRPSHEEVLLVLRGSLRVRLDGAIAVVGEGEVVHVPPGAELGIDGGPEGASAWVTTTAGLTARIGQKTVTPPWAQ